jgi:hypothetical protein
MVQDSSGARHLEIRVPRHPERPVQWNVFVSDDLAGWKSADGEVEILDDGPGAFVIRDRKQLSESSDRRFLRIQPQLDP